jgi:hypothetical protein
MLKVRGRSDGAQQGLAVERVEATVKMTRMLSAAEQVQPVGGYNRPSSRPYKKTERALAPEPRGPFGDPPAAVLCPRIG